MTGMTRKKLAVVFLVLLAGPLVDAGGESASANSITVEDIRYHHKYAELTLKKCTIEFDFSADRSPEISRIIIDDVDLKIKNLPKIVNEFKDTFIAPRHTSPTVAKEETLRPLFLELNNIFIGLEDSAGDFSIRFSFKGDARDGGIQKTHQLAVADFNAQLKNGYVRHARLEKAEDDEYVLTVPEVKIKDKEIRNLVIPLQLAGGDVVLKKAPQEFLGPKARVQGILELNNIKNTRLRLDLDSVSLAAMAAFFSDKEDVALEGMFNGKIDIMLAGGRVAELKGYLQNDTGGSIRVKKEAPLNFLRKRVTEDSYGDLVEKLKNYLYNEGRITISTENADLIIATDFSSHEMGKVRVSINFHDVIGGRK